MTLVNSGTNFSRIAETNSGGQYVADTIPTGSYTVSVEVRGFQKLVRSGIQLTAGDTIAIDLRLIVGNVQQAVEVVGRAPLLQSQTAAVSNLVANRQIVALPLNGRTFTSLVLLTPGAYVGSSGNLANSPYAMRGSTNISVNGSSAQNNSYLIDGLFNRNLWLSTLVMVPTVDSIQEFRVFTSNYSAEYGAAAGAVTIVQTKSGTNELHGSMYEFLRNDKLDANTFFNNRQGRHGLPSAAMSLGGRSAVQSAGTRHLSLRTIRAFACASREPLFPLFPRWQNRRWYGAVTSAAWALRYMTRTRCTPTVVVA